MGRYIVIIGAQDKGMDGERARTAGEQILKAVRRLYDKGMIDTFSGNVSVKLDDDTFLITPGGSISQDGYPLSGDKIEITQDDLARIDMQGNIVDGKAKPSSEWRMHAAAYKVLPKTRAVVHPHPVYTLSIFDAYAGDEENAEKRTRLGLEGLRSALNKMEEPEYYIGRIGGVGRLKNGSDELANGVAAELAKGATVVVLEAHGVTAVGPTLYKALGRAEALEIAAMKRHYSLVTQAAINASYGEPERTKRVGT